MLNYFDAVYVKRKQTYVGNVVFSKSVLIFDMIWGVCFFMVLYFGVFKNNIEKTKTEC